jgi:tetratricopeptide (TPR) repeat protein
MDFLARGLVGAGRLDESEALLKEVIANERAENADSLTQGYAHFLLGWVADYRQDAQPAEQEMRRGLDIWASRSGLPQPELTLVLADLLCTQDARRQEGVAMVHDTMRDLTARFGTNHPFVANVKHVAAVALWHAGLLDEAEVLLREAGDAFARGGQAPIQNHVLTMQFHGQVLRELGRLEQSEAVLRQGLALADKFTPEQWHHHYWGSPARLWVELAAVCELQGRHDEAAAWARHVQDEMNQHNDCALAEQAAVTFLEVDRRDDALLMAQSLLEARRRDPRTTPEQLALAFRIVAVMQETLGRLDESEASRREQVRTLVAARGEANAGALDAMNDLAWLLDTRGKPAEAEPFARAAAEGYRRLDHPRADDQIDALDTWTVILCDLNRPDDAAATFAEMQDRWAAAYPQRPLAATYQLHYGKRLLQMHHFAEAQTILLPYVERMIHDPSSAEGDRRQAAELAADLYRKWNEVEPAKGYDVKAAEWSSRLARPDVPASRSAATRP